MRYFFTCDEHFGHANILKYCGRTIFMTKHDLTIYNQIKDKPQEEQRKFKISNESLERMNEELIRRWNERVKIEDLVFVVGDFCFKNSRGRGEGVNVKSKYYESKLNGQKIFIKGNHDKNNSTKTIIERIVISIGGKRINLVHNPEFVDINYSINFTGHVHEKWKIKRIRKGWQFTDAINVGVDVWSFRPITFEEIMKRYNRCKKQLHREGIVK